MSSLPDLFPEPPDRRPANRAGTSPPSDPSGSEEGRDRSENHDTIQPVLVPPPVEPARISFDHDYQDTPPDPDLESEEPLAWYSQPAIEPPTRIPHLGHVLLLCLVFIPLGLLGSGALTQLAIHKHLLGIANVKQAVDDIRFTLGSQATFYFITFVLCLLVFPAIWGQPFFTALHWRAGAALRLRWRLIGAAFLCFMLAIANGILLPGPPDTPIDRIFRVPGAAWLLFGFGITLAPFFEEIAFRGFLLPALCTAFDWTSEHFSGNVPRWPTDNGHPRWSISAMIVGSVLTSVPFALMHAEQTGYSLGPFLLLVCVSMVLCWVRLATRSLAASVLVHSTYNFLLFSLMLAGTGGFRHLDKM